MAMGRHGQPRAGTQPTRPPLLLLLLLLLLAALATVAAAFVVPGPAAFLLSPIPPFRPLPHPQQQEGSGLTSSSAHGRRQRRPYAHRRQSLTAAPATTTTAVTQEEGGGGAGAAAVPPTARSIDELLAEIRANAGTPQVLSLLKEAVAATGTGEVKREFFKVCVWGGGDSGWRLRWRGCGVWFLQEKPRGNAKSNQYRNHRSTDRSNDRLNG
jgi:hypothetical protein